MRACVCLDDGQFESLFSHVHYSSLPLVFIFPRVCETEQVSGQPCLGTSGFHTVTDERKFGSDRSIMLGSCKPMKASSVLSRLGPRSLNV